VASDERYFSGLYCAVASTLTHLNPARKLDVKVLDGGLSQSSRDTLSRLTDRIDGDVGLEFVTADASVFGAATLGPCQSHMAYCRILMPQLLDVPRVIYLDCDTLIFRDPSELFDFDLPPGRILAAVPDSETLTLRDDSHTLADTMNLPDDGRYFNSGVMLMNLDGLRKQHLVERAIDFLSAWKPDYRFHDQSAINFLLHGQIEELPEHWNRASWRFDQQDNNDLNCVLHYTRSAPWLGGAPGPAQALFERFAADAGLPVNRQSFQFRKSMRQTYWRNMLAPLRALAFAILSLFWKIGGRRDKSAGYGKVAHHWFEYVRTAPRRRRLYHRRAEEIQAIKFKLAAGESPQ